MENPNIIERMEKAERELRELRGNLVVANFRRALGEYLEHRLSTLPFVEWPNEMRNAAKGLQTLSTKRKDYEYKRPKNK